MRRDVVFDKMSSWYSDAHGTIGADVKDDVVVQNDKPLTGFEWTTRVLFSWLC